MRWSRFIYYDIDMNKVDLGDKYLISDCGNVWSNISGKYLSRFYDKDGYMVVGLVEYTGYGSRQFRVHRAVASSFIQLVPGCPEVNHKDGDKGNPVYANLEWCDRIYNVEDALLTELTVKGLKASNIVDIFQLSNSGKTAQEIASLFGVTKMAVCYVLTGKSYSMFKLASRGRYDKISEKALLSNEQLIDLLDAYIPGSKKYSANKLSKSLGIAQSTVYGITSGRYYQSENIVPISDNFLPVGHYNKEILYCDINGIIFKILDVNYFNTARIHGIKVLSAGKVSSINFDSNGYIVTKDGYIELTDFNAEFRKFGSTESGNKFTIRLSRFWNL